MNVHSTRGPIACAGIIAAWRSHSHNRRSILRTRVARTRTRQAYFGASKPAAVHRGAIAREVRAATKARAAAGSLLALGMAAA
jgi:hypothetical protein